MLSWVAGAVVCWLVWRALDLLFRRGTAVVDQAEAQLPSVTGVELAGQAPTYKADRQYRLHFRTHLGNEHTIEDLPGEEAEVLYLFVKDLDTMLLGSPELVMDPVFEDKVARMGRARYYAEEALRDARTVVATRLPEYLIGGQG